MAGMADQHDPASGLGIAAALDMHLGDQRAGCVDHRELALFRLLLNRASNAVGAEHGGRPGRNFGQFFDENRTLGAKLIDHEAVVDDFVPYIDRCTEAIERTFDNIDRARHPCAKAAGIGKNDVKARHRIRREQFRQCFRLLATAAHHIAI